jgi:hypothetical protein
LMNGKRVRRWGKNCGARCINEETQNERVKNKPVPGLSVFPKKPHRGTFYARHDGMSTA